MEITITYKEQFDKLTQAYISGEVDPYNCQACFVGNLLNGYDEWASARCFKGGGVIRVTPAKITPTSWEGQRECVLSGILCIEEQSKGLYNIEDIARIEEEFLRTYLNFGGGTLAFRKDRDVESPTPQDEEALFKAFGATLELLKKIHIEKGEDVDQELTFTKRQLQTA